MVREISNTKKVVRWSRGKNLGIFSSEEFSFILKQSYLVLFRSLDAIKYIYRRESLSLKRLLYCVFKLQSYI